MNDTWLSLNGGTGNRETGNQGIGERGITGNGESENREYRGIFKTGISGNL